MTSETDQSTSPAGASRPSTEPIAGDPLLASTAPSAGPVAPPAATPPVAPPAASHPTSEREREPQPVEVEDSGEGGSKIKTAAVVAGAAALANKVRQEAPKVLHQLRERRITGRRVILTEVDGRFLAIGPYKNEDQARQDAFKVGGTPRIAELVPHTAFFAPPDQQ
jgi:hypothetical protein